MGLDSRFAVLKWTTVFLLWSSITVWDVFLFSTLCEMYYFTYESYESLLSKMYEKYHWNIDKKYIRRMGLAFPRVMANRESYLTNLIHNFRFIVSPTVWHVFFWNYKYFKVLSEPKYTLLIIHYKKILKKSHLANSQRNGRKKFVELTRVSLCDRETRVLFNDFFCTILV